jgi:hypothetical protein
VAGEALNDLDVESVAAAGDEVVGDAEVAQNALARMSWRSSASALWMNRASARPSKRRKDLAKSPGRRYRNGYRPCMGG